LHGGLRKLWYGWKERHELQHLGAPDVAKKWFLVPLQVHNDSQIQWHSPYRSMEAVIDEVMHSFARHAPADARLVFKHHPMDRAYCDFGRYIAELANALGVAKRVTYVHDLHLPSLLRCARGVITVNSTVGLQALHHGTPVHTLGDALYDMPGLVHQGGLAGFWTNPGMVNSLLYWRFRTHLISQTQLNVSFYGAAPAFTGLAVTPQRHAARIRRSITQWLRRPTVGDRSTKACRSPAVHHGRWLTEDCACACPSSANGRQACPAPQTESA
jgi:capsular polysaccharide export protein